MILEHRNASDPNRSLAQRAWSRRSDAGSRSDWTLAIGSFLGMVGLIAGLQLLTAPRSASESQDAQGTALQQRVEPR